MVQSVKVIIPMTLSTSSQQLVIKKVLTNCKSTIGHLHSWFVALQGWIGTDNRNVMDSNPVQARTFS